MNDTILFANYLFMSRAMRIRQHICITINRNEKEKTIFDFLKFLY